MNKALKIQSVGLVSGLARSAEANCAAMRLGYDCFQQTDFRVPSGHDVINGAPADFGTTYGITRLAEMLALAVEDALNCCSLSDDQLGTVRPIICLPNVNQPYIVPDIIEHFHEAFEPTLDACFDHSIHYENSGALGFIKALQRARRLLETNEVASVLIGGVDNLLTIGCINHYGGDMYGQHCRLLTEDNADGFIPGEAAAVVLLTRAKKSTGLWCTGIGTGTEPAPYGSGKVTRAEGLVNAVNTALGEAGYNMHATDYRISNLNGERYFFDEDALTLQRTLRPPKAAHPLWHPADSIGNIGAAFGPTLCANVFWAARKGYAPGSRCLGLLTGDGAQRAAFTLEYYSESNHA